MQDLRNNRLLKKVSVAKITKFFRYLAQILINEYNCQIKKE